MSMLDWPEVHHTEVDGVPVVWASVPGPLRAGLMLRVGSADETLVTSGITHLLEHLALFGIGRPGDHSNGHVDQTTLHLHCVGDAGSVTHFIGAVSRQLTDVPTARLADELGVLRSELAGRRSTIEDSLLAWRYGALTYGLTAQTQYALETVDADQIRAWAGRHATRGNAVIWLSGPPPVGAPSPPRGRRAGAGAGRETDHPTRTSGLVLGARQHRGCLACRVAP